MVRHGVRPCPWLAGYPFFSHTDPGVVRVPGYPDNIQSCLRAQRQGEDSVQRLHTDTRTIYFSSNCRINMVTLLLLLPLPRQYNRTRQSSVGVLYQDDRRFHDLSYKLELYLYPWLAGYPFFRLTDLGVVRVPGYPDNIQRCLRAQMQRGDTAYSGFTLARKLLRSINSNKCRIDMDTYAPPTHAVACLGFRVARHPSGSPSLLFRGWSFTENILVLPKHF